MRRAILALGIAGALCGTVALAQRPVARLTATSVNVSEPGNNVRIEIFRWSNDQERNQLVASLTPTPPATVELPPPQTAAAQGEANDGAAPRGGRGGARGGAAGARGGGAGGARGGGARGGGRAGNAAPADPIATFTTAVGRTPTVGYIWTNEVIGYAVKFASRLPSSDGSERVILVTDRRLGANTMSWTPAKGTPTPYQFTLLEIRLPSRGSGEAKTSLTANIVQGTNAQTVELENYSTAVTQLENVKRN